MAPNEKKIDWSKLTAIEIVDEVLKNAYSKKWRFEGNIDNWNIPEAFEILEYNYLIRFRGTNKKTSYFDITETGKNVIDLGGYARYLELKKEADKIILEKKEIIDRLEFIKLKKEVNLLNYTISDYKKTKKRNKWAFIIAVIAILISVLEFLLRLLGI